MQIQNGLIFTPQGDFRPGAVCVAGERFAETADANEVIDAQGGYCIPGLIDLHFHGCVGHNFSDGDPEGLREMARYELQNGITSICPAGVTESEETLTRACKNAAAYDEPADGAALRGVNIEGPFLSREKKGAQNEAYLREPDAAMLLRLQAASNGLVRLVTVAPELPGTADFLVALRGRVRVSVGHTTADYDTAAAAFAQGAGQVTHLYNAMPPFTHRAPGVIGAAADAPGVFAELICDGIHIHPSAVRAAFRLFGKDRMILISDSMAATGMPGDGDYVLGELPVHVSGRRATLHDGTLAGSVTNLFSCMRIAVKEMGIPLEHAVLAATRNPARSLGVENEVGSIEPGKVADLLVLDEALQIKHIIHRGKRIPVGA